MKKLNEVLAISNITTFGFPAFKELEDRCNKNGESAIISTLAPGIMLDMGITTYYSPIIPRNTVFKAAEEIIYADLDVVVTTVSRADDITADDDVIIVSRHAGTVEILKSMYPNSTVLASVAPDNIRERKVVGTLPPTLIQHAAAYKAAAIKDFDYNVDGDLSGETLKARLIMTDSIKVTVD